MAERSDPQSVLSGEPSADRAATLRAELLALVRERGYRFSEQPFLLSSGGSSHDYVDMRRAVAEGAGLRLAADALLARLSADGVEFDAIGGMTMGADPVAHAIALLAPSTWFSVRKADKEHGARQRIEGGQLDEYSRVVVFEDTVSTGRSVLDTLEVVAATGAQIVTACTLLDRGEQARAAFASLGVPYTAILTYHDLGIDPLGPGPAAGSAGPTPP